MRHDVLLMPYIRNNHYHAKDQSDGEVEKDNREDAHHRKNTEDADRARGYDQAMWIATNQQERAGRTQGHHFDEK